MFQDSRKSGTRILFLSLLLSLSISTSYTASASIIQPKKIDLVSLNFLGKISSKSLQSLSEEVVLDVIPRWKRQNIQFEIGLTEVNPMLISAPLYCSGTQISSFLINLRKSFYQERKIQDSANRYLVAIAPKSGCIWEGISLISNDVNSGGVVILQDTTNPFVIGHELGHTLGLGHSNFLQCSSGVKDGPWSNDCKAVEYGGAIDLMSNVENFLPLSTYHQWRLGSLSPQDVIQNWVDDSVTLTPVNIETGIRAIFVRDGNATYWIEYRRAAPENGYQSGLVIYRTDPPPARFILSPNPEDSFSSDAGTAVTTDIWMLNLDNFKYSQGRVSGSMTLGLEKSFTTYSRNITFSIKPGLNPDTVNVSITRKRDLTAPKKPLLVDKREWSAPGSSIINENYLDSEWDIKNFEIQVDGKTLPIDKETQTSWTPTYLNPLSPKPSVLVKQLPEGQYNLSVRAVDYSGNISSWSDPISIFVDRSFPKVSNNFVPTTVGVEGFSIKWEGTKDIGAGLCETDLLNDDGFVLQRDKSKENPKFSLPWNQKRVFTAEVYDCLGNGVSGKLTTETRFISASQSKRTSKWLIEADVKGWQRYICRGSCSASLSIKGAFVVVAGNGSPEIFLSGIKAGRVPAQNLAGARIGYVGDTENKSRVLRISGKDFSFYGIGTIGSEFEPRSEVLKREIPSDPSLEDSKQVSLQKFGFRAEDFGGNWGVLPMQRGTTLQDPTLDLCMPKYQSDQNRLERRQVAVFQSPSPYLFLSNEVVRYKDGKSANEAFNELDGQIKKCKSESGGVDISGQFETHIFNAFPTNIVSDPNGSKKVFVRVNIGSGSNVRSLIGLYQFYGEIFSGIYVVRAGANAFSDEEVSRWLDVAEVIERRLTSKS